MEFRKLAMWYDLLMLAILAFTTVRGAAKGMAWQLAAIAALVLCFVFATPLSLIVAPAINLAPPLNRWVSMLGIYLAFSFGCFSMARLLRGWLEALKFTEYDRHLGALFGFLKGATFCLVLTFFAVCLSETACGHIMQTRSGRIAGEILEQLAVVMPAELRTVLQPHLRHFDDDHVALESNRSVDDADRHDRHWNDRDEDGFRGSSLPDEDRHDPQDEAAAGPESDEESADHGGTAPERGIVGRAVDTFEEQLKSGVKNWINDALNPRVRESPSATETSRSETPAHQAESDRRSPAAGESVPALIAAVSGLFSTTPQKQAVHQAEIEALLHGIPNPVAVAALRDWRADLLGTATDPDPETDAGASLDRRLLRQLTVAGRTLNDLPRPVRERLRAAESE